MRHVLVKATRAQSHTSGRAVWVRCRLWRPLANNALAHAPPLPPCVQGLKGGKEALKVGAAICGRGQAPGLLQRVP